LLALTLPFHLAGLVQLALPLEPWIAHYMVFLEMGGRWLLPLAFAAAIIPLLGALAAARPAAAFRRSVYYYYWRLALWAVAPRRSRATSSTSSRPIERARAEKP